MPYPIGKKLEEDLAELGSICSGVVVCRSSPSQKADIVRIMREYEMREAEKGWGGPLGRFLRRQNFLIKVCKSMLLFHTKQIRWFTV